MRILSRSSALARLQAALVSRALAKAHPGIDIECLTRASAGDRDLTSPLWQMGDRGAFTADLSQALLRGEADVVVHSFKDMPIELPPGTQVAGALPRADPRDVLLVRRLVVPAKPQSLTVLSSSPRRAWLLQETLPSLLPWPVGSVATEPVRGNIETRLRKLVEGEAHGLVVAKAALDRLLTFGSPFDREASVVRGYLDQCYSMVLPMREFPWAPAQGAIALEIAEAREDLRALLAPVVCRSTTDTVAAERRVLAEYGGGCHQALGAAMLDTAYGRVVSVRARGRADEPLERWELHAAATPPTPQTSPDRMWPGPGEDVSATRRNLTAERPGPDAGLRVARAEALPAYWAPTPDTYVWTAGSRTWRKLAAQGVWVHGCADGLGDDERPPMDALAGREIAWVTLTHAAATRPGAIATYVVETAWPDDLPSRSHFFWTSGSTFTSAVERWPAIRAAWHASGPGRTHDVIDAALGGTGRVGVWLDRASWERDICL